jgi:hypothetical protein
MNRKAIAAVLAAGALTAAGVSVAGPASATAACGNSSFTITATATDGATGHATFVLEYYNKTATACTIYGYPGLDALNSSGHVLAHATRTLSGFTGGAHHEVTVLVAAHGRASARVEWMNFNPTTGGSCAFSTSIATTPANTSDTVHLAKSVSVCDLQVHPTVAGTTGNN